MFRAFNAICLTAVAIGLIAGGLLAPNVEARVLIDAARFLSAPIVHRLEEQVHKMEHRVHMRHRTR